jgi:hypothetical protein
MLESLVRLKFPKPQAGSYAALASAQLQNIDPALATLFAYPTAPQR